MVQTCYDEKIKIGSKVIVTSNDGVFSGKVVLWEPNKSRISIKNGFYLKKELNRVTSSN